MTNDNNNNPGQSGYSGYSGQSGKTGQSGYSGKYRHYADGTASSLRKPVVYTELRFYQRSDVLYQLTCVFCKKYLPKYGDRTVDQMIQAARCSKQNIVEGSSDGQTSTESELRLLGIARGSNKELMEDYLDYLKRHRMEEWHGTNPRFESLHTFCRNHSLYHDYADLLEKMNDEEMANMAICLCHQVDSGLTKYIEHKDREFTTEGGIRERMTAARLGQRETQRQTIERQAAELSALRAEIARLNAILSQYGLSGNPGESGISGISGNPGQSGQSGNSGQSGDSGLSDSSEEKR